eukprot:GEMP01035213.1.p1 GENE.GEMP01035213.1~~GEMP01035213.1.p1  ORF type:complete len:131 (-),score=2.50 GEMP01035213.1:437-829(-)
MYNTRHSRKRHIQILAQICQIDATHEKKDTRAEMEYQIDLTSQTKENKTYFCRLGIPFVRNKLSYLSQETKKTHLSSNTLYESAKNMRAGAMQLPRISCGAARIPQIFPFFPRGIRGNFKLHRRSREMYV